VTKRTTRSTIDFPDLGEPWTWLKQRSVPGYEIHHGATHPVGDVDVSDGRCVFATRNVLGVYLHGLFEDPEVLLAFSGSGATDLETTFERLADIVDEHMDGAWLRQRFQL
jgi:adenosylcobyric acid synthase